MKDDDDNNNLSIADTTKLAGTIDTLELTGIQVAIICNAIGLSLNNTDMLPKDLRENPHYMNGSKELLDYVQSHIEMIIGR